MITLIKLGLLLLHIIILGLAIVSFFVPIGEGTNKPLGYDIQQNDSRNYYVAYKIGDADLYLNKLCGKANGEYDTKCSTFDDQKDSNFLAQRKALFALMILFTIISGFSLILILLNKTSIIYILQLVLFLIASVNLGLLINVIKDSTLNYGPGGIILLTIFCITIVANLALNPLFKKFLNYLDKNLS
jgi:hypothetical protein